MQTTNKQPHAEMWGDLAQALRFHQRVNIASIVWAFLALSLATYGLVVAHNRPLVYYVDPAGKAAYGGPLEHAGAPQEVEVRYVAKLFTRNMTAYHSLTIADSLAAAQNLMTPTLQKEHANTLRNVMAQRGGTFADFVRDQEIRMDFEPTRVTVTNYDNVTWHVIVRGMLRTWPLSSAGKEAPFQEELIMATMDLVRVARTESTPNGLLVNSFGRARVEHPTDAEAAEATITTKGEP